MTENDGKSASLDSVACLHWQSDNQGCHWTFAKITENLRVRAVSQKMNTKRDKVQKEKDEIGENRERIGLKITEKNGK